MIIGRGRQEKGRKIEKDRDKGETKETEVRKKESMAARGTNDSLRSPTSMTVIFVNDFVLSRTRNLLNSSKDPRRDRDRGSRGRDVGNDELI